MTRKYDESLQAIQEMQQAGTAVYHVDDMEFGRRLAVEKELEADEKARSAENAVWDESGNFILYPNLLGIKGVNGLSLFFVRELMECAVVNVTTNKVVRLLGKDETARWLNLSLYQGAPSNKGFTTVVSSNFLAGCDCTK